MALLTAARQPPTANRQPLAFDRQLPVINGPNSVHQSPTAPKPNGCQWNAPPSPPLVGGVDDGPSAVVEWPGAVAGLLHRVTFVW